MNDLRTSIDSLRSRVADEVAHRVKKMLAEDYGVYIDEREMNKITTIVADIILR